MSLVMHVMDGQMLISSIVRLPKHDKL